MRTVPLFSIKSLFPKPRNADSVKANTLDLFFDFSLFFLVGLLE